MKPSWCCSRSLWLTNDIVFKLLDGEALIPDGYVWRRD